MKLYGLYTPSHEPLLKDWLLPSLRDPYTLCFQPYDQVGPRDQHVYGTPSFTRTTLLKVEVILRAIRENWGDVFVYSDVDVQFFRPTEPLLRRLIRNFDLLFQRDSPEGIACAGFFACRTTPVTLGFWESVHRYMLANPGKNDQDAVNDLLLIGRVRRLRYPGFQLVNKTLDMDNRVGFKLRTWLRALLKRPNRFGLRWNYLPDVFMSGGTLTGRPWSPGMILPVPSGIVLHHVNWTLGIENKIAQLRWVRKTVENGASGELSPP